MPLLPPLAAARELAANEQISGLPPNGYGYGELGTPSIERLKAGLKDSYPDLRNLVRRLLEQQGLIFKDLAGLHGIFILDEEARASAELALSDTGPLGVKALGKNILELAKTASGQDKGQLEQLEQAVTKAFAAASQLFAGKAPLICQQTRDFVLQKLAAWALE